MVKVYSIKNHNYGIKINKITYYLNSLLVFEVATKKKVRIQLKRTVNSGGSNLMYKTINVVENYYLKTLLGESLGEEKPKFLSEGIIKNVYIHMETGLQTIEIFNHEPLTKKEIDNHSEVISKNFRDILSFSRWSSFGNSFQLSENLELDYSLKTYSNNGVSVFYDKLMSYEVVNIKHITMFAFTFRSYEKKTDFQNNLYNETTQYLLQDDDT